ncbi:MAG: hypothetical protein GXP45_03020, partial [bacterium]|nr:hypothetical protein [bacterium]
ICSYQDIINLKEGKAYLDIAEKLKKLGQQDTTEENYYQGEYYKLIRDFDKAREYFLKVYNNPHADLEYKY